VVGVHWAKEESRKCGHWSTAVSIFFLSTVVAGVQRGNTLLERRSQLSSAG